MYPPDWPRCRCGDFTLDGHLTCGRAVCDEGGARRGEVSDAEIDANLERNHNLLCGCATPNEDLCALVSR